MQTKRGIVAFLLLVSSFNLAAIGSAEAVGVTKAGLVVAVDKVKGVIVVGDMGPLLSNGTSEIRQYTLRVTPSTEWVGVKRASGRAPSGWIGDFVETKLTAWDVKPGDFVAVAAEGRGRRLTAVRITVVDTSSP